MTDKTFTRAGVSTDAKGKTRFRYTNDLNRETVLVRGGHTDIVFYELGEAMDKEQAEAFLRAKGLREGSVAVAEAATEQYDDDGFVEPKSERVQVLMCQLARREPTLTAQELLDRVTAEYGIS